MGDEVEADVESLTKGKGKSGNLNNDNNTGGSQRIDADQADQAEFLLDINALPMLWSHCESRRDSEMAVCKRRVQVGQHG